MDFVDPQGRIKEYFAGVIIPTVDFFFFSPILRKISAPVELLHGEKGRKKDRKRGKKKSL